MAPVFTILLFSTLQITTNGVPIFTTEEATTLHDVPIRSTRGFECLGLCFHFTDNIYIKTVDLWCRCPVETIYLPREELYHQPLAMGSPPLLESEATESMKTYVRNFLYLQLKLRFFNIF